MSQVNGTSVLVYADGTLIAAQTGVTINFDQDLIDTSNKSSSGWKEHINGMRSGSVDCDALYSTSGVSAETLLAYITGRSSLLLLVDVNGDPVVCEVDVATSSIAAPTEGASTLSASFNCTGGIYMLVGTFSELITGWTNVDYDTLTSSGTSITSAITDGSAAAFCAGTQTIDVTDEDVYKVFFFLTLNSGNLPDFAIRQTANGAAISNVETAVEGANFMTLTATASDSTSYIVFKNDTSDAANFSTSSIYVFKI